MRISIGALSKAFHLSDEALRFYEKKGLVTPERNAQNGYRTFSRTDIQRVANVKRYQNQGFQLDEIGDIYTRCDESTLESLYQGKIDSLAAQIRYQQHLLAHMQTTQRLLQDSQKLTDQPQHAGFDRYSLLLYDSIEEMWEQHTDDPVLHMMFSYLPITSFTTVMHRNEQGSSSACSIRKGILVAEKDRDLLPMELGDCRVIDARNAVSILCRLENGSFRYPEVFERIDRLLAEEHLTPADDLFTVQRCGFRQDEQCAVNYTQLILPVRGQDE